jgi:hypothetical protein
MCEARAKGEARSEAGFSEGGATIPEGGAPPEGEKDENRGSLGKSQKDKDKGEREPDG